MSDEVGVERVRKIKNTVDDRYRSLLKDASDLAEVDGYSQWRKREADKLSKLVQTRIRNKQNPSDCKNAKKLVCLLNSVCLAPS